MTDDEKNLNLLAIFHYIIGSLTALFSCVFFIHLAIGIGMLSGAFDGRNAPPKIFAWFFTVFASVAILSGWTLAGFIIAAGSKLKRRTSRTFCLVVAGLECAIMPLGTILGVFTIVILMKESVKQIFKTGNSVNNSFNSQW